VTGTTENLEIRHLQNTDCCFTKTSGGVKRIAHFGIEHNHSTILTMSQLIRQSKTSPEAPVAKKARNKSPKVS
jgi:hypothetical protein